MDDMIISVHMPKAGGSSLKMILQEHFKKSYIENYDAPMQVSYQERTKTAEYFYWKFTLVSQFLYKRNNVQCIHGHFLPYKYSGPSVTSNRKFVTWLRDPIERLGSHYYYIKRNYNRRKSPVNHRKVVEQNWSLEEFCFSKEMKNIYSQFMWKFPKEKFDFIGITEFFEEDIIFFSQEFLDLKNFPIPLENVNPKKPERYFEDLEIIEKLKNFHSEDYKIYDYALKKRLDRTGVAAF